MNSQVIRYSNTDLEEFKAAIDKELEKSNKQLQSLNERITNLNENIEDDGDWMEDSTNRSDLEMLQTMTNRQRKHIADLQNALTRIHNKSYGICIVTGELIDKRRLLAVLTTSKSLAAKNAMQIPEKTERRSVIKTKSMTPQIISRIVKPTKPVENRADFEDDDDDLIETDENKVEEEEIDFDSFPAEE